MRAQLAIGGVPKLAGKREQSVRHHQLFCCYESLYHSSVLLIATTVVLVIWIITFACLFYAALGLLGTVDMRYYVS